MLMCADDWSALAQLPITPDNVKRVTINGRELYTAVGFRELFQPPFSSERDSESLWDQVVAASVTAWRRFSRDYMPFPRLGGLLFPVGNRH